MNRRRFLEALAAVGVVVACGPTATPSPSPSSAGVSPAPKPVSIEWWRRNYAAGTQSAETITSDAAVKAYKDRAANVTIAIQGGPFGAETDQKFDIAILQQHAGPDVFHTTGGDVLKYGAAGQLSKPPFTDDDRKDFNASSLQATTYKGSVVAYPLWIVPWYEYINLDLFKEAGVEPPKDGVWTYQQFSDAAKKLTMKRADGTQVYGFAQGNDEYAFLLIDGARPYSQDLTKWTFNGPQAESGFNKWLALPQGKVVPPDYLTLKPNDAEAHFANKDVAILQRPSAFINVLNGKPQEWKFGENWDIANFPKGDADQTGWGGLGFIAVREQQDADKKAAARAFAQRYGWSYIFIGPTLVFFALFTVVPVLQAFTLSLQNATIVGGAWVGFDNFVALAGDPIFRLAVLHTVVYALITVAAQIFLA